MDVKRVAGCWVLRWQLPKPTSRQAFMESIAYDTVNTLDLMRAQGIAVERIRITGGGSRSAWWTQLKADMTNMPVEVVTQPEPGTLGAALLGGYAIGLMMTWRRSVHAVQAHKPFTDPTHARGLASGTTRRCIAS